MDEIAAVIQYESSIYIFSRYGKVWRMYKDGFNSVKFEQIFDFPKL